MSDLAREVVRKFQNRLATAQTGTDELLLAVYGKRRQASLESMLASHMALDITVLWEGFVSDILVAYVASDPSAFMRDLRNRMEQSIQEKFGAEALKSVALSLPSTVTVAKASAWIDPKDFNFTVKSAEDLTKRANGMLSAPAAKKFTLEPDDAATVDFSLALRNYLAHRSPASRSKLVAEIGGLGGANADLKAPMHEIGAYLKARTAAGTPRVFTVASRLLTVAGKLA